MEHCYGEEGKVRGQCWPQVYQAPNNDEEVMTLIEYKTRECVCQDKHRRLLFQVCLYS